MVLAALPAGAFRAKPFPIGFFHLHIRYAFFLNFQSQTVFIAA